VSDWELRGGKDIRRISAELRHVGDGKQIKKRMTRELRNAAAPMVPAVRQSIAAIPVKGPKSTGLRQRLQRATRLSVRTVGRTAGVRILVDPHKMPDHEKSLPQMVEGLKPWNHPVYPRAGETRGEWTWVNKQPPKPYFFRAVRPLGVRSRIAVNRVLTGITRDIT
jgi:hypothetical protein